MCRTSITDLNDLTNIELVIVTMNVVKSATLNRCVSCVLESHGMVKENSDNAQHPLPLSQRIALIPTRHQSLMPHWTAFGWQSRETLRMCAIS